MHRLAVFCAGALGAAALSAPLLAGAQLVNFGGTVMSINYCAVPLGAVNIMIIPAGVFPISYVWYPPPTTLTATAPFTPPFHLGQQVLGVALPVPIPCVGFGTHPPVWSGLHVLYGGYSLGF